MSLEQESSFSSHGGRRPNAGRKKGVPTQVTQDIRQMIKDSLEGVGGTDYLMNQARENPVAFMGLIGKIIPKEVEAHVTGTINWPVPQGKLG